MEFKIPRPLKVEHKHLHAMLHKATMETGELGKAAKTVAKLMHPHFVKEEEYALPPLGLLPQLARGKVTPAMKEVLMLTDKLRAELGRMLEEHKAIVAALDNLVKAAKEENKPGYAAFAEQLKLHAKTEEEVTYPTCLLIGEYLKCMLMR